MLKPNQVNKIRAHSGGCMAVMKTLPDDAIACTITSPPYNKGEQGAVLINAVKYDVYRDNIPETGY